MSEGIDLNKLRAETQKAGKSSEESVTELHQEKGGEKGMTAIEFEALPPEEQRRLADENDTTVKGYLSKLRIRDALRANKPK